MRVAALAVLVFALDWISKQAVLRHLPLGASRPLIPGVLHLTHVQNPGAAFGLMPGRTGFLLLAAAVAIAAVAAMARQWSSSLARWGAGLLLGGAAGNFVERLRHGTVTDFIDLRVWPVFNLADAAIVIGGGLLGLYMARGDRSAASGDAR